jgi:hypothetical protein
MCGTTFRCSRRLHRWLTTKTCSLLLNGTDKICGFRTRNQSSDFFHENCRIHNLKCIVTTYDLVLYKAGDVGRNVTRNHFCRGKTINITHSACVSIALVIQQTMRMRRIIIICGLSKSTMFLHVIS